MLLKESLIFILRHREVLNALLSSIFFGVFSWLVLRSIFPIVFERVNIKLPQLAKWRVVISVVFALRYFLDQLFPRYSPEIFGLMLFLVFVFVLIYKRRNQSD